MVTRKQHPTPAERAFWQQAFLAAELPTLLKHNGRKVSPQGAAHLMADFADAAMNEYRMRFGERS